MSTLNPYLKEYKKNQLETATPEQILILLYDGAINFLNKSKLALEEKNEDAFHKNILGCRNIILEFMNSLDLENGGKVAETLYALYRYYNKILMKSEISGNLDGINEVLRHLADLRETWIKAIEIANQERQANMVDKYEASSSASTNKVGEYDETDDGYDESEEDDNDDDSYDEEDDDLDEEEE